jgi:hypothetical protein
MAGIGGEDYRRGAYDRLTDAFALLRQERFGGAIYLAGRAVEGMLRGVIWHSDPEYKIGKKSLETGHDLRAMLQLVRSIKVLRGSEFRESIGGKVQAIARLWNNNMRYLSDSKVESMWYNLGEIDGKRRTMKNAAADFCNASSLIIRRCEAIWQQ